MGFFIQNTLPLLGRNIACQLQRINRLFDRCGNTNIELTQINVGQDCITLQLMTGTRFLPIELFILLCGIVVITVHCYRMCR